MKLKVLKVKKETPSIFSLELEPEPAFSFKPGQYLTVFLPVKDEKGNSRQFSIASSPTEQKILLASRQTNSIFKQKLESLKKDEQIEARGPFGGFTLIENKPAVMLSGGIGITPLRCMIKYATDKKLQMPITLFYANRNPEEIAFKDEFDKMTKANKNLKIVYAVDSPEQSNKKWTGYVGYLTENIIRENVNYLSSAIFYICGPPKMVDTMFSLLKSMNIPEESIRIEHFEGY